MNMMVVPMKPEHLPAVVDIHKLVLGDTLNARLGTRHLAKLYQTVLQSKYGSAWTIVDQTESVLGFIAISRNMHALERQISKELSPIQYIRVALVFLRHPMLVAQIFQRRRFTDYLKKNHPVVFPVILTIGVSPVVQKGGFGAQLIQQAVQTLNSEGIPALYVDTKAENKGAVRFYEKMGFRQLSTIVGNVLFVKTLK